MSFNVHTFKTRTATAAVFVVVMLGGLLWNKWSFLLLFSIIHMGCWWEYIKLVDKITAYKQPMLSRVGLMLAGYGCMLAIGSSAFPMGEIHLQKIIHFSLIGTGLLLWGISIFNGKPSNKSILMCLLGFIYITVPLGLLLILYPATNLPNGPAISDVYIPAFILITIWINDTMAYIVGSLIGKKPLSKVSPKKTWEGTIGGIVLCVVTAGGLLPYYVFKELKGIFIFASFVIAISGTIGDLWESKLKRMSGVKDSGSIMPGHGGFLDRFDSLLFAVPFAFLIFYGAKILYSI